MLVFWDDIILFCFETSVKKLSLNEEIHVLFDSWKNHNLRNFVHRIHDNIAIFVLKNECFMYAFLLTFDTNEKLKILFGAGPRALEVVIPTTEAR